MSNAPRTKSRLAAHDDAMGQLEMLLENLAELNEGKGSPVDDLVSDLHLRVCQIFGVTQGRKAKAIGSHGLFAYETVIVSQSMNALGQMLRDEAADEEAKEERYAEECEREQVAIMGAPGGAVY